MGSSPLLVASVIAVALILVQVALITLRNLVRNRLFPVALNPSTSPARHSGDPSIEE